MAGISDIKHRMKSIEDTRQITKAMELISVSKMRKALIRYENNLTYFLKVRHTIKDILTHSEGINHPFLTHREGKRTVYVVIAADKGLAGGYNKNVLELAWNHMQTRQHKYLFTVGHMAREFFGRKGQAIDVEFLHTSQSSRLRDARRIAADIVSLYEQDLMDEVLVVFTRLKSTVSQQASIIKLLPVELEDLADVKIECDYSGEITYDPAPDRVLGALVPQYIVGLLYTALIQSSASEHSMRMLAMSSANRNADEMTASLRLKFNRARQEQITNSLSEIVSAASLYADASRGQQGEI